VIDHTGGGRRLGSGVDSAVENRLPFVALAIIAVFVVFLVRLFQLQILEGDDLRRRSERNSVRSVRLEAPRGDIVDRHGATIATTRPAFGVEILPSDLHRPWRTFEALGSLLERDPLEIEAAVGKPRGRARFQPVSIDRDLPLDLRARVESHRFAMDGVVTDVIPRRLYEGGDVAAHLLGYIGEIQKEQLETRSFADYRPGEVIGQAGIERWLESELRGRAGGQNVVVNVAGRVMGPPLDEIEPEPGNTVVLTIDFELQKEAVAAFLPDVVGEPEKMGALVALDPRNGDVLALVSRPAFDPNAFAGGIDAATWKGLVDHPWRPLQNRAISGQYPPGSTYKAFVAAAALQEGAIREGQQHYCPGSFTLGRRTYRCWKKEGHGSVAVHQAIVRSCDVFFYNAGLALGVDRLAFFARGFGFGRLTEIDLGQETAGLVPTSEWKERRMGEPWQRGETVSISIGQGFNLTTPLQLAVGYAAIANGGDLVRPRLLLRVERRDGTVLEAPPPEVRGRVPVDPEHLAVVRDGLRGVVNEPGGTGGRSRLPDVEVAGKTGTAQVVRLEHTEELEEHEVPLRFRDHAWFVAFAPVDAPEIVVAVLVEHGGHGGSAAAPIARRVLARYFEGKHEPLIETDVAMVASPDGSDLPPGGGDVLAGH
jgi:penicillin-binding protein 2